MFRNIGRFLKDRSECLQRKKNITEEEKQLRRMTRSELLELLLAQTKRTEELEKELAERDSALTDRSINIENAGSIAEAALKLNGVFEAAEESARQYVDNIRTLSERQKSILDDAEKAAEKRAAEIIEKAETEAENKMKAADEYCLKVLKKLEQLNAIKNNLKKK